MKKTEIIEFQWVFGGTPEAKCTSAQFNKWMDENREYYPGFRITHFRVNSSINMNKQPVETMFIVFEYSDEKFEK